MFLEQEYLFKNLMLGIHNRRRAKKEIILSVAAIIIEPEGMNFYVPVSTESFFQTFWTPAIKELKLELLKCLDPGIDLSKNDLSLLIEELEKIKTWAAENSNKSEIEYLKGRVDFLIVKLIEAFNNGAITIYIG